MDDYYCGTCREMHLGTVEGISCPICVGRYCLESIEGMIYVGNYNCLSCNLPLENFPEMPNTLKDELKTANFPKYITKVISEVVAHDGSRNIPLQKLRQQTSTNVDIVEETLTKLIEEGKIGGWIEEKVGAQGAEEQMLVLQEDWNVEEIKKMRKLTEDIKFLERKNHLFKIPLCVEQLLKLSVLTDEQRQQMEEYRREIEVRTNEKRVFQELENQIKRPVPLVKILEREIIGFIARNYRVIGLGLSSLELTSLPKSFGNLSNLQVIHLQNNELTSLPKSFGNLSKLKHLNLDNNQLPTLPESIGSLQKLKDLYLSHNQLTTLPESIGDLQNLQNLSIEFNLLTTLPESFKNLTNLRYLNLYRNYLDSRSRDLAKSFEKKGCEVNL
ncbi:MAG: leucine-rich repeat domain-containing protein [Candidatus Hodarchaeales archaeon]|jgi:Leucine-rich repeat (LRR) protein